MSLRQHMLVRVENTAGPLQAAGQLGFSWQLLWGPTAGCRSLAAEFNWIYNGSLSYVMLIASRRWRRLASLRADSLS
jgi:hypothetical protein